jgi:sugar phosphate permease
MGITTSGIQGASVILVPLMSFIGAKCGFRPLVWSLAIILSVYGIASWFWIRERPEDVGLHPDNKPLTEYEKEDVYHKELSAKESQEIWSFKEILNKKYSWAIMVTYGFFIMFASGINSTTIPFAMESGLTKSQGLTILSIASICSIIADIIAGYFDTKFGPKIITLVTGSWIFLACISLLIIQGTTGVWFFLIMAYMAMGTAGNLLTSIVADIYGRNNFTQVFRVLYFGVYIIRGFTFLFIGTGVNVLGSYRAIYIAFGSLALISIIILSTALKKRQ